MSYTDIWNRIRPNVIAAETALEAGDTETAQKELRQVRLLMEANAKVEADRREMHRRCA